MNLVYLIDGAPFTRCEPGSETQEPVAAETMADAQKAIRAAYAAEGYSVPRIEVLDWSGPMKLLAVYAYAERAYDNPPALLLFSATRGAEAETRRSPDGLLSKAELEALALR